MSFGRYAAADAVTTKALAAGLAPLLRPGDLLILRGGLGAGKTTFTQGLGAALRVTSPVASPTFVIAREHEVASESEVGAEREVAAEHEVVSEPEVAGAEVADPKSARIERLVHVDAYRLGGAVELDALDLDSDLDRVVTVVEWGSGLAEALNTDRLEIDIERERGDFHDDFDPESGLRTITLTGVGPRWAGVPLDTLDSALKDS